MASHASKGPGAEEPKPRAASSPGIKGPTAKASRPNTSGPNTSGPQKPGPKRSGATAATTLVTGAGGAKAGAKELARSSRDAKRAEKARRKASSDPADMGRLKQIARAYQVTHEFDKPLPYLLAAAFVLPILIFWALHFVWDHPLYLTLLGVMVGLLLTMILLVQRAKRATFKRYAGQAGSAEVALQMLPKQWVSTPVITATRQQDAVHRTLGPGGLVLIGEGEPGRLRALLAGEVKKHQRVASGVAVTTIVMGEKEGQVPLSRLAEHIRKLPKTLQPNQITDIKQRLRALDAVRPTLPVPRGPMPTSTRQAKGSRQAMRGR